ncbi:hypothetical protein LJC14_01380 [Treponema sp. OttesenSCG-928-L16]|nr:hypothetical protein [Treponema sp. OttesenSCG-928-L16]
MKYVVIGAGRVGGCLGARLAEHGKDVCLISRGAHLRELEINGLQMDTAWRGKYGIYSIEVSSAEQYTGYADVIFVCAEECAPEELAVLAGNSAVPGTAAVLLSDSSEAETAIKDLVPGLEMYPAYPKVSAYISKPGTIRVDDPAFMIDFSLPGSGKNCPLLDDIAEDLRECGITVMVPWAAAV